jgi:ADP-ribose pyrophosphatase
MGDNAEFRDESVFAAGRRELHEETGFEADNWQQIMECPASAGMSSETLSIIRASGLVRTGKGGGDSSENITVHVIALDKVDHWLDEQLCLGKLLDPKIYSALYWISKESE